MNQLHKIQVSFHWADIDTVLLDMDGTLLDKYYDDYFWDQYVPAKYAEKERMTILDAEEKLLGRYKKKERMLEWTDLDYWSKELGLDIPYLKMQVAHLINVHPYVIDFLEFCQSGGKKMYLVTNAHPKTIKIKMGKIKIGKYFNGIVCSEEVGIAKENMEFWDKLEQMLHFNPERTLLVDDNENVLFSAKEYGLAELVHVAKSSSRDPVKYSKQFPAIVFFKELMEL